jgi:hypothetical protein
MYYSVRKIGGDGARAQLPQNPTFPLEEQSIMVANAAPYSSKIIRAGALLPDTKLLLAHWNLSDDVEANLRRIQQENLFGKASRSRVAEILAIFKQRYLGDPQVLAALVTLVLADIAATMLDPILYFLTVQADPLLYAVVIEVLTPLIGRGQPEIYVTDIEDWLRKQIADGKTQGPWTGMTTNRAARCRRGIKFYLEVDRPILKLQSISPAFVPHCLMKTLRVMELSCPCNNTIEHTLLRQSPVN